MVWFDQELEDLEAEHKAASDLFEKQKEEAMATMKKSEDLKSLRLAKSQTRCKLVPQSTFFEIKKKTSAIRKEVELFWDDFFDWLLWHIANQHRFDLESWRMIFQELIN